MLSNYIIIFLFLHFFNYYNLTIGGPVFIEQLNPQIRSIVKHDLLLRCQAVSDELLDIAYVWTHNNMPLANSNSELIGHVVSISLLNHFKLQIICIDLFYIISNK